MTNTEKKDQESKHIDLEHISQESEYTDKKNDNTIQQTQIDYDGITWVKYIFDYLTYHESPKKECTVIFPLESKQWIWDYKMVGQNKIIIVDDEEYKIIGFSWQCYDGIMKNGSSIELKKFNLFL
jgi:hypothetical protein